VQVPATAPPPPRTENHWYGWQTLVVDAGWIMLGVLGSGSNSSAVSVVGIVTYFLGGPVVHWAHGHGAKGAIDLGIRLGAPVVGALLGLGIGGLADHGHTISSDGGGATDGAIVGAVLGAFIGLVGAITVDAAVLANEDVPATSPHARAKTAPSRLVLVPIANVSHDKSTFGFGARF
jgi:hypothetical protein